MAGGGLIALPLALKLIGERSGRKEAIGKLTAAELEIARLRRELETSESSRSDSDNRLETVVQLHKMKLQELEEELEEVSDVDSVRSSLHELFSEADRILTVGGRKAGERLPAGAATKGR